MWPRSYFYSTVVQMQNTKPKSAKETKTQTQAMTTENERNPYMKIENQIQCQTHV